MLQYPDFTSYGYRIEKTLGQNFRGGRNTFLATQLDAQVPVVIKQFQFAQTDSNWQEFQAVQQEILCLQGLNFAAIPHYLDSFETEQGWCLVQEYKAAPSLAQSRNFTPLEIQKIAIAILEILVYLQQQSPPIIHRDIKPENILVDESLNVYLVDFGFARPGGGEVSLSSMVKGTLGFMPPEQLLNRQLTTASDLYSLGVTLICLLTQTPSGMVNHLFNESYQLEFLELLPPLPSTVVRWLQRMVAPQSKERFANAAMALESLQAIDITAPEPENVDFYAAQSGQPKTGQPKTWQQSAIGFAALFAAAFSIGWLEHLKSVPASMRFSSATPSQSSRFHSPEMRRLLTGQECVNCNLRDHNFRGLNLAGVNLQGANLTGAQFQEANLARANLMGATLERANLRNSNLRSAQLMGANLERANLRCAKLIGADLGGANLQDANLRRAQLMKADLTYSNLMDADLTQANLRSAALNQADLTNANLREVVLPHGVKKTF